MNKSARLLLGTAIASLTLAAASGPVFAADVPKPAPKQEIKVLVDNERVKAQENKWVPGAESENIARPDRIVRAIKGGTLQRIFPDGKKTNVEWKTGEVQFQAKSDPYIVKNIGKHDVVLYVVNLK